MDDNAQAVGASTPDLTVTANGCKAWKCTEQHICDPWPFSVLQLSYEEEDLSFLKLLAERR